MADRAAGSRNAVGGRELRAASWAADRLGLPQVRLDPVSGDASFRRYFRIRTPSGTRILMDAPPDREDSRPFVEIASRLRSAGLRAPVKLTTAPDGVSSFRSPAPATAYPL